MSNGLLVENCIEAFRNREIRKQSKFTGLLKNSITARFAKPAVTRKETKTTEDPDRAVTPKQLFHWEGKDKIVCNQLNVEKFPQINEGIAPTVEITQEQQRKLQFDVLLGTRYRNKFKDLGLIKVKKHKADADANFIKNEESV